MDAPKPTMTIRPLFNLAIGGGLFALMMVIPLFTDLPFLTRKNAVVYFGVVLTITFALLLYLVSLSYQWIELDGSVIRGRKLVSRRLDEWPVDQVVEVVVPSNNGGGTGRNFKVAFKDGTSLTLVDGEMTGMQAFMTALGDLRLPGT